MEQTSKAWSCSHSSPLWMAKHFRSPILCYQKYKYQQKEGRSLLWPSGSCSYVNMEWIQTLFFSTKIRQKLWQQKLHAPLQKFNCAGGTWRGRWKKDWEATKIRTSIRSISRLSNQTAPSTMWFALSRKNLFLWAPSLFSLTLNFVVSWAWWLLITTSFYLSDILMNDPLPNLSKIRLWILLRFRYSLRDKLRHEFASFFVTIFITKLIITRVTTFCTIFITITTNIDSRIRCIKIQSVD